MQYLVGLIVFSVIGSFLISDAIAFWRELRKSNRRSGWYSDFLRLLVLGGMTGIGYMVASETFQKPHDWLVFLVIGIVAAVSARMRRTPP